MPSQQWINVLVVLYAVIASEVAVVTLLNGLGVVAGTVLLAWLLMG